MNKILAGAGALRLPKVTAEITAENDENPQRAVSGQGTFAQPAKKNPATFLPKCEHTLNNFSQMTFRFYTQHEHQKEFLYYECLDFKQD